MTMSKLWKKLRVGLLALMLIVGSVSTLSLASGCEDDDGPIEETADEMEETADEMEEETD
jgi:hypothetical protein